MAVTVNTEDFHIPLSSHHLQARWHHSGASILPLGLAIIAHPWGRLGGTQDDHVVVSLARYFASSGVRALTFDARGVGCSGGSTTWTGNGEVEDYRAVVDYALSALAPAVTATDATNKLPTTTPFEVYFCGYSFGSLAASLAHFPEDAVEQGTSDDDIRSPSSHHAQLGLGDRPISVRYVLVSYPLNVLWALSLFRSSVYSRALEGLFPSEQQRQEMAREENSGSSQGRSTSSEKIVHVLALYGPRDQFTSLSSYDSWASRLRQLSQRSESTFCAVDVDGADHFWGGGAKRLLLESVEEWRRGLRDGQREKSR